MIKPLLHLQIATQYLPLPSRYKLLRWLRHTLVQQNSSKYEVTIRMVDAAESADLNRQYRNKVGPTNVLSFSYTNSQVKDDPLLGDLVICAPLVAQEAAVQAKSLEAHWAHLVIHGTLHLLGFDHENETEAEQMEALEIALLAELKFPNPYQVFLEN